MALLRALLRFIAALALLVVFAVAVVGGLSLHLGTPAARRVVADQVTAALDTSLAGSVVIESIGSLSLYGVGGLHARVVHPDGESVVVIEDASVDFDPAAVLSSLFAEGPLFVHLPAVTAESVRLDASSSEGSMRVAEAFAAAAPTPADPNAKSTRVAVDRIDIELVRASGYVESGDVYFDADLEELEGSLEVLPDELRIDVARAALWTREAPRGIDLDLRLRGALRLPIEDETVADAAAPSPPSAMAVSAEVEGFVADTRVSMKGVYDGEHVHAYVLAPLVSPDVIGDVAPEAPAVGAPVMLLAIADGTFEELGVWAVASASRSRLEIAANVETEPVLSLRVEADGRELDFALLGGPVSSISLTASADARLPSGGEPRVSFEVRAAPGVVSDVPTPAVTARGELAGDELDVKVEAREPGVHIDVVAEVLQRPGGPLITFDVEGSPVELDRLERRGLDMRGTLHFESSGQVDLASRTIQAEVTAAGRQLAQPGGSWRVGSAELDGTLRGALANPHITGSAIVRELAFDGRRVSRASVRAEGPARTPRISIGAVGPDIPQVEATTRLDLRDGLAFDDVDVALSRDGTTARARADRISIEDGMPSVRDLTITGLGEPTTLSLERAPDGRLHVAASSEDVSIQSILALADIDAPIDGGRGSFDVNLRLGPRRVDGHLEVRLRDATIQRQGSRIVGLDLLVNATFLGQRVIFHVAGEAPSLGEVRAYTTNLWRLGGPPTEIGSWVDAVGGLAVRSDLDLAQVALLIPPEARPFHLIAGRLELDGRVSRDAVDAAPSLSLDLETERLTIVGKAAPGEAEDATTSAPDWVLRGIDFEVHTRCDATAEHISLSGSAFDQRGRLVELDFASDVPYGKLLREPAALDWLADVPVSIHLAIPRRKVGELPAVLQIPKLPGEIAVDARIDGTLRDPKGDLVAGIYGWSIPGARGAEPLTAKVNATYEGSRIASRLTVDSPSERILTGEVEARAPLADLILGDGAASAWTASADLRMGPFPLETLQPLIKGRMRGHLFGRVRLEGLNEDASLMVELTSPDLVLAGVQHEHAEVELDATDGALRAGMAMRQTDGSLEASVQTGLVWGDRLVPELRANREIDGVVDAQNFRLAAIQPLTGATFSELDGRLDGSIRIADGAKSRAGASNITGQLRLTKGEIELAAGGGPLSNVRGRVIMEESGILRLKDVHARGLTGEIRAEGIARIANGTFAEAKLNAVIPDGEPMPVLAEGQHLADVSGVVNASARWVGDGRVLRVEVDVPELDIILPESAPDGVQDLDAVPRARIGTFYKGQFVPLPLDAPDPKKESVEPAYVTQVVVNLRDVDVVRGDMLEASLVGQPQLVFNHEVEVSGTIRLEGGWIDVKGRLFEIERGTITFTGKPTENPDVNVTAKWTAADGTVVYADYVGPLQTGEIVLRSNPPLSQQEIVSLVVFGSAEGFDPGAERADGSTQAVGLAGSFAASGLNKVLDDVTKLDIRTRVDTSSSTNPRPELALQIVRNLALEISYVLGDLPPGRPPDKTFATLDWNFRPEWSLETTLGDKGSSTVDLVWEHVY